MLLSGYRNKRQPDEYIGKGQNYSSNSLDKRSVTRPFPKKRVDEAAVAKNIGPSEISLAIFDCPYMGIEILLAAWPFPLNVLRLYPAAIVKHSAWDFLLAAWSRLDNSPFLC